MHVAVAAAKEGIDEKQPARQCGVLQTTKSENEMDLPPSIRTQNSAGGLCDHLPVSDAADLLLLSTDGTGSLLQCQCAIHAIRAETRSDCCNRRRPSRWRRHGTER